MDSYYNYYGVDVRALDPSLWKSVIGSYPVAVSGFEVLDGWLNGVISRSGGGRGKTGHLLEGLILAVDQLSERIQQVALGIYTIVQILLVVSYGNRQGRQQTQDDERFVRRVVGTFDC